MFPLQDTNVRVSFVRLLVRSVSVLVVLLLAWKLGLTVVPATPPRASELVGMLGAPAPGTRGTQVLIESNRPGAVQVRSRSLPAAQDAGTEWSRPARVRHSGRMVALVESYGYSRLPVILTLDEGGRVVHAAPASRNAVGPRTIGQPPTAP